MKRLGVVGAVVPKVLVLVGLCSILVGCGGGAGTVPVKGKVTIKGQPAPENSRINFVPTVGGVEASGIIDAEGNYELFSGIEGNPGIMPGKYKVFFTPDASSDDYMNAPGQGGPPGATNGPFPQEYTTAGTTPLEKDVAADTKTIDIDIP